MTTEPTPFLQALRIQAGFCLEFGSPFSARMLDAIGEDIERGGPFSDLADRWADIDVRGLMHEAVMLRILGALHHLVLTGADPALATGYPADGGQGAIDDLGGLAVAALVNHPEVFVRFMASPPQTNEVRRSLCLVGGFLTVAKRAGLPLRCLELGASAGLNMNWDRYRYDFGGQGGWGDLASPLLLAGDWIGPAPPVDTRVEVVEKRACDQNPIDVRGEAEALQLQAYVWPDQADRLARLKAAIALARQSGVTIDKADAADWCAVQLAPRDGVATVFYHSVVWPYLPPATTAEVTASIHRAGESATASSPFAWLRMENEPGDSSGLMDVRLKYWPGGEESLLARVHPHGAKVSWLGE